MSTLPIERTDADLLTQIGAGSHDALAELYHRHARWILQRLTARCSDPDIVDTALQDTFISVWRSAGSFRPTAGDAAASAGGWLWSIAIRRLVDVLRRRRPATPTADVPEPDPLPPPGTPAFALLTRLPPDLHAVATAVYLDGLSTAEAATLLGIPQGTVKSRLARARPLIEQELR